MFSRVRLLALLVPLLGLCRVVASQDSSAASSSSKSKQKTEQHVKSNAPAPAPTDEGLYRNPEFGFTYQVRYGWVDRTEAMQPADNDSSAVPTAARRLRTSARGRRRRRQLRCDHRRRECRRLSRPQNRRRLHRPAHRTHHLQRIQRRPRIPTNFLSAPQTLVRGDFTKDRGQLTMYQSSLVMLRKGSIVSFTFIGGSEDEVEELIEKVDFPPVSPKAPLISLSQTACSPSRKLLTNRGLPSRFRGRKRSAFYARIRTILGSP